MKTLKELSVYLRERRTGLGLSQKDMLMRIGMSQQQYQRIESEGDLRLTTLFRVLEGMSLELMLIPREKKQMVQQLLSDDADEQREQVGDDEKKDAWGELLGHLASDEP